MSINQSGLQDKVKGGLVSIYVDDKHPLIKLASILPWDKLFELILSDLQKTTLKGKWWCGRGLRVRTHLGVYILQQLFNKKDRQIEAEVKENAVYQIFCGKGIVEDWHCPDHSKIEDFRSRLCPTTHQTLANLISQVAVSLGFAEVSQLDIDSTIQAANMSYPRDVNLIVKLSTIAHKVGSYLNRTFFKADFWDIDITSIKSLARQYYYTPEKSLLSLWSLAYEQVSRLKRACELVGKDMPMLPWFIKKALRQLQDHGQRYFLDLIPWILRGEYCKDKALSFHLREVSCFNKKTYKGLQFGRSHQLGRLKGNFLLICNSDQVRMEDRASLPVMVQLHQQQFGQGQLLSFAADRGYVCQANKKVLEEAGVQEIGLQIKASKDPNPPPESKALMKRLQNRRSGIEPLIGHLKQGWQMGRTRMKTDKTSLSSAYTSVLGFNIRQLMRHQAIIGG